MDEFEENKPKFLAVMMEMGIVSYREQESLWDISKRCAKTVGVTTGAGTAILGAGGGAVVIPVVGSVPGYIAGFLAGMTTGTASCVALNYAYRDELRQLAQGF